MQVWRANKILNLKPLIDCRFSINADTHHDNLHTEHFVGLQGRMRDADLVNDVACDEFSYIWLTIVISVDRMQEFSEQSMRRHAVSWDHTVTAIFPSPSSHCDDGPE